ncbi:pantoate--beta-alanine ligase [Fulvivirgaceae bacterium LMO-SS25]
MELIESLNSLREKISGLKTSNQKIGFVPTMGALHSGHIALVEQALKECDFVICSIFVNPAQFNNPDDLEKYPRTISDDKELLEQAGCHALFIPSVEVMYPKYTFTSFQFGSLEKVMEGAFRPGHFSGVALIVSKLFNLVQPDLAFFGQKDWQQVQIINCLIRDLNFPIELRIVETIRDENGLALSSRNQRLTEQGRINASRLFQILKQGKQMLLVGKSPSQTKHILLEELREDKFLDLEYLTIANSITLQEVKENNQNNELVICIAAYIEGVRLIDNILVRL